MRPILLGASYPRLPTGISSGSLSGGVPCTPKVPGTSVRTAFLAACQQTFAVCFPCCVDASRHATVRRHIRKADLDEGVRIALHKSRTLHGAQIFHRKGLHGRDQRWRLHKHNGAISDVQGKQAHSSERMKRPQLFLYGFRRCPERGGTILGAGWLCLCRTRIMGHYVGSQYSAKICAFSLGRTFGGTQPDQLPDPSSLGGGFPCKSCT